MEKSKERNPVTIIVNSRPKEWDKKEISYEEVVVLAFDKFERSDRIEYTVSWILKNENQSGTLVQGDSIKTKKDMRFNVKRTDRS